MNVNANLMVENVTKIKSGITMNVAGSVKIKKHLVCEKDCICNPATYSCRYVHGRYVGSIIDDSVITFDDYLLVNRALLISATIHCYLIKYRANEKHLFPYYVTNNKVKVFYIDKMGCISKM